jgi:hypothetical protein
VPGTVQVVKAVPKLLTRLAASRAAAATSASGAPLAAAAPATCKQDTHQGLRFQGACFSLF